MFVGYFYGIARANVTSALSHFIFDASVLALYATQLLRPLDSADRARTQLLRGWVAILVCWPLLLLIIPLQDPMVQLVGLRAHIYFLPFLLFGARLDNDELYTFAKIIAALNVVAFGFALGEFFLGVPYFYPENEVTALIYRSNDIRAAGTLRGAFRIPAIFANSGLYGAVMAMTVPFLLGATLQKRATWTRVLLASALVAAVLGVFFSATRTNILVLGVLVLASLFSGRMGGAGRVAWVVMLAGAGWAISANERLFLRVLSLSPDAVIERIGWSMNAGVLEHVMRFPLGNGLGGGGTSVPYFLLHLIRNPMPVENTYATIMLEQGLPGLLFWVIFLVWALAQRRRTDNPGWALTRTLGWIACVVFLLTGFIGQGLFTAIPFTPQLLLMIGWLAVPEKRSVTVADTPAPPLDERVILARAPEPVAAHRVGGA